MDVEMLVVVGEDSGVFCFVVFLFLLQSINRVGFG